MSRSFVLSRWTLALVLPVVSTLALPGTASASVDLHNKAGCNGCHMVDTRLVGPSYKEVAVRYKGRTDAVPYLANRIRKGGPGNWGQVPMMANDVSRISDADLNVLIQWLLKTP